MVNRILIFFFLFKATTVLSQKEKPNIIIILADDMGYSDLGCYGSEISTPNIDKLASNGLKFTQFYNAGRCCPSRASLLTGVYPHQAGMGEMVVSKVKNRALENSNQGWLSRKTVTLAEVLKTAGYRTLMAGKWHVGEEYEDWPMQRGFDSYYGLISGANSYYELLPNRKLVENNTLIKFPENKYFTDLVTEKALAQINASDTKEPFFLYLAYTAPHWPLHAPKEEIEKYIGKYMIGWDRVRKERFDRQKALEIFKINYKLQEAELGVIPWETAENKDEWDLRMATYAAMISRLDYNVGRLVSDLKAKGKYENTMIVFLSDNGACAEILDNRAEKDLEPEKYLASLKAKSGSKESYVAYDKFWAFAGNTPFRLFKQYTHEGGIATPMIVHFPKMIKKGFQTNQVGHIIDIMPTVLEISGAIYPTIYNNNTIKPVEGKSLVPILNHKIRKEPEFLAWEHFNNRAIRAKEWKLVWTKEYKKWELYNIKKDRTETTDLALINPKKKEELIKIYENWAKKVGVKDTQ